MNRNKIEIEIGFTGQMVHSTLYSKLSGYVVIEMKQKVVVVVIKI